MDEPQYTTLNHLIPTTEDSAVARVQQPTLKRRASASFPDGSDDTVSRKRMKEEHEDSVVVETHATGENTSSANESSLADQLAQELQCGCCSELVYRPVLFRPCEHFFCGSCCVLWIRNGGSTCPHCRADAASVTPFRAMQSVIDVLLRAAPHKARTERERQQADEVYRAGALIRIPSPRELSPEPDMNPSEFVRPCPNCLLGNPYGWQCPQPIAENTWPLEDGTPPGHALCGNCETLLALPSPLTTKCDFCQVSFCGIGVQGRCVASPLMSQHPHGLSDVGDLIQSSAVYECFNSNTVEVDIMLDYLTAQQITPRHVYRDIVTHIQSQPRAFLPLIEQELFVDIHPVPAGPEPDAETPRNRICRICASEVFLYGLRDWFLRERQKGFLEESVLSRKDCVDGTGCTKQQDLVHAREFNHMIPIPEPAAAGPSATQEQQLGAPPAYIAPIDPMTDAPPPPPPVSDFPSPLSDLDTPEPADEIISAVPITASDNAAVDVPILDGNARPNEA
ncbi:hypothetical protein R3P38DRAFT_2869823 [Favolaschia claudopus]|uniref:RING-type domain-containing protein n=1 Tax=Favolaschia claudopus TaxID=2862362 RepID=A0AAW0DD65_9AGAR